MCKIRYPFTRRFVRHGLISRDFGLAYMRRTENDLEFGKKSRWRLGFTKLMGYEMESRPLRTPYKINRTA